MKRLMPILSVLLPILAGCQTIPETYTTLKGMPCNLHSVIVDTNNLTASLIHQQQYIPLAKQENLDAH